MNSINKRYPLAEPFKTESNIEQMCLLFFFVGMMGVSFLSQVGGTTGS